MEFSAAPTKTSDEMSDEDELIGTELHTVQHNFLTYRPHQPPATAAENSAYWSGARCKGHGHRYKKLCKYCKQNPQNTNCDANTIRRRLHNRGVEGKRALLGIGIGIVALILLAIVCCCFCRSGR